MTRTVGFYSWNAVLVLILFAYETYCTDCIFEGATKTYHTGEHCFGLYTKEETWQGAADSCKASEGVLSHSNHSTAVYETWMKDDSLSDLWLGVKEVNTGWQWIDGTQLGQGYWNDGAANNGTRVNCVSMDFAANFQWVNKACSTAYGFICQINAPDKKCPGHTESTEVLLGHTCYVIKYGAYTWFQAADRCRHYGGELAIIDQEPLMSMVQVSVDSAFKGKNVDAYWIGLRQSKWITATNKDISHINWHWTEPRDEGQCVKVHHFDSERVYQWASTSCEELQPFICEKYASPTASDGEDDSNKQARTIGLVVLFVILLIILIFVLVIFFCYYRRGKVLRARARQAAEEGRSKRSETPVPSARQTPQQSLAFINRAFVVTETAQNSKPVVNGKSHQNGDLHDYNDNRKNEELLKNGHPPRDRKNSFTRAQVHDERELHSPEQARDDFSRQGSRRGSARGKLDDTFNRQGSLRKNQPEHEPKEDFIRQGSKRGSTRQPKESLSRQGSQRKQKEEAPLSRQGSLRSPHDEPAFQRQGSRQGSMRKPPPAPVETPDEAILESFNAESFNDNSITFTSMDADAPLPPLPGVKPKKAEAFEVPFDEKPIRKKAETVYPDEPRPAHIPSYYEDDGDDDEDDDDNSQLCERDPDRLNQSGRSNRDKTPNQKQPSRSRKFSARQRRGSDDDRNRMLDHTDSPTQESSAGEEPEFSTMVPRITDSTVMDFIKEAEKLKQNRETPEKPKQKKPRARSASSAGSRIPGPNETKGKGRHSKRSNGAKSDDDIDHLSNTLGDTHSTVMNVMSNLKNKDNKEKKKHRSRDKKKELPPVKARNTGMVNLDGVSGQAFEV